MTEAAVVTQHTENLPVAQSAGDVNDLVRLAIDKGVDVEILERLVALGERVTERNARGAFFDSLAAFQDECPEINKSTTAKIVGRNGAQFSYTFAPLEEITRTIRPVLKTHRFSYSWTVDLAGGVLNVTCVLRHIEGHEERSSFPVPIDTAAAMSGAQKNGAALTYGKRQSLIAVLGLTTADQDIDGAGPSMQDGDDEPINDQQLADIDALVDDVGADRVRFLKFLKVRGLSEIKKGDYARAVAALEEKRNA